MSKASKVIQVMQELQGTPVGALKDLKLGDNLVFKDGTQYAGMLAIFHSPNSDGTANVMIGKSNRMNIPLDDLLRIAGTSNGGSGVGTTTTGGTAVKSDGAGI
jgi:hypothetical protein